MSEYSDYNEYPIFDPDGEDVISREEVAHNISSDTRSAARRMALQVLYEVDITRHAVGQVMNERLADDPGLKPSHIHASHFVRGVLKYRTPLDVLLSMYAPEFPIDQIAIVDRNVLRIALFEMIIDTHTPISVAIDEAVQLSKIYGAENTSRFVNGVLGAIALVIDSARATFAELEWEETGDYSFRDDDDV